MAVSRDKALDAFRRRAPDMLVQLQDALSAEPHDGALLIAMATARVEAGTDDPLAGLREVLHQAPDWGDGHTAFARLQWELGESSAALAEIEAALAKIPSNAGLLVRYMALLSDAGEPKKAADIASDLRGKAGENPDLILLEARYAGLAGDNGRAEKLFCMLSADWPEKAYDEARHRIRQNRIEEAELLLETARKEHPGDIAVWALTEICWRSLSDDRHGWLLPKDNWHSQVDLGLEPDELAAIAAHLRSCHAANARPLGQSVRGGTQTRGNLFLRGDPAMTELTERCSAALSDYWNGWAGGDADHPAQRRGGDPPGIVTSWSILVKPPGYHVSHIHDSGIVSSACHIDLDYQSEDTGREGYLELGRPPSDLHLDCKPLVVVAPKPGHLVLFPSFVYHGTRPISSGERLTVAFDAI
ncbi:MAG: putative 2OG-Fe(II) oxygenase [Sphingorhabdus sp.]